MQALYICYSVLSNMLSKSNINPLDSQEAKPYKNDPEIIAMTRLRLEIRFTLFIDC